MFNRRPRRVIITVHSPGCSGFQFSAPGTCSLSYSQSRIKCLLYIPWISLYRYELVEVCYLFLKLFYISRKSRKCVKFSAFSLETESHFSFLIYFFFSQDNAKKQFNDNVSEMFNFDPKMSTQKCPIFCGWYSFFSANVSTFYTYVIIGN